MKTITKKKLNNTDNLTDPFCVGIFGTEYSQENYVEVFQCFIVFQPLKTTTLKFPDPHATLYTN